jgi:hypothetical protein
MPGPTHESPPLRLLQVLEFSFVVHLRGQAISSDEEVKSTVRQWFRGREEEEEERKKKERKKKGRNSNLVKSLQKRIEVEGYYMEQ